VERAWIVVDGVPARPAAREDKHWLLWVPKLTPAAKPVLAPSVAVGQGTSLSLPLGDYQTALTSYRSTLNLLWRENDFSMYTPSL